jgi:uncharacterized membrane protein
MSQSKSQEVETLTLGQKVADVCSKVIGSWTFIGLQSAFLAFWIILNLTSPPNKRPDPYPFILLNLMLSFQAAYTGPVLLMAANRQNEIDRKRAIENLELDRQDHYDLLLLAKHIDKHFDNIHVKIDNLKD